MKPEKVDRFLAKRKEKEAQKSIDIDEQPMHDQEPNRSPSSEANSQQGYAAYVNSLKESTEQTLFEKNSNEQVRVTQEHYSKERERKSTNK